jgi:hypothetical protein
MADTSRCSLGSMLDATACSRSNEAVGIRWRIRRCANARFAGVESGLT